jgi:Zn-dependent protease
MAGATRHRWALRLGQVAGIEVYVDASALAIVALITWALAEGLPTMEDDYPTLSYWLVAAATAVLFVAALLAHELSHSVVARRRGIEVRDITLWLLGGVSTIEDEPESARDELAIAVAGPAMSVAIGLGLLAAGATAGSLGCPMLLVAATGWLGVINLILAGFNLVPAAPLDGGRVLLALLWRRTGDRLQATRAAARAGETFAWVLFALGIVEIFLGAGIGGIWAVLLGWYLLDAARNEGARALVEQRLAGVRIGEIMSRDPITAPDSIMVEELLDHYVVAHHRASFPLTHDGRVTGLVTLARLRALDPRRRAGVSVGAIAWPLAEVTTARPDEMAFDVLRRQAGGDGRVLVLDDGALVGIVSPSDFARVVETVG